MRPYHNADAMSAEPNPLQHCVLNAMAVLEGNDGHDRESPPATLEHKLTEVIPTTNGPVRGFIDDGMQKFQGIPYAAPPVDALRWRPPIAPAPWQEPLTTLSFKTICAQDSPAFPGFASTSYTEDCLYVNVFTPAAHRHGIDQKLPVMVWVHGGGFACGASNDYNPTRLVNDGNVIFVSLNYRVNVFGFFSHPAINAEGHAAGNYGVMDQQLALTWVQENIEGFGGDKNNVTIFGQSAGGACIMVHLTSISSQGLFHKAIIQSGGSPPVMPFPTIESLEKTGTTLASAAGCDDQIPENLRRIPTRKLMAADALAEGAFGIGKFPFGLMEDGYTVPRGLRENFATGKFTRIPLITGINRDEFTWFQAMMELRQGRIVSADAYPQVVESTIDLLNKLHLNGVTVPKEVISQVLEMYPVEGYPHPSRALAAIVGDGGLVSTAGRRTTRVLQKYIPEVYAYEFRCSRHALPLARGVLSLWVRAHSGTTLHISWLCWRKWHCETTECGARQAFKGDGALLDHVRNEGLAKQ